MYQRCHLVSCLHIVLQASLDAVELDNAEGFEAAADAGFMLAVLATTGLAAPDVPLDDSWAVQALHTCARAGSEEAQLALAHRYYLGDGVPKSCHEGVRSRVLMLSLHLAMHDAFECCTALSPCSHAVRAFAKDMLKSNPTLLERKQDATTYLSI